MSNPNAPPNTSWYEQPSYAQPNYSPSDYANLTPKQIHNLLKQSVINQDEATKQAAMQLYLTLHNHRSVYCYVGHTASGKTYIFEQLQRLFPGVVYVVDASGLSSEGFSGNKKWSNLFTSIPPHYNILCVLDEVDKSLSFHHSSSGEAVNQTVMNEGLSILSGTYLEVPNGKSTFTLDTHRLSFALLGAFSNTAKSTAEHSAPSIGFGASQTKDEAYSKPFTIDTLREHGLTEEFCGRINKIITLNKLDESTYLSMLNNPSSGPIQKLQDEYNIIFHLPKKLKEEIATEAVESQLGTRVVLSKLQNLIEESLYEQCDTTYVRHLVSDTDTPSFC